MADEVRLPGDFPLWTLPDWSQRFGVRVGITGRATSDGEPVDLGLWGQQPVGTAMAAWQRFLGLFPEFDSQVLGHQVHGAAVAVHHHGAGWCHFAGVDGHVTARPGVLLLVTVADCVPIYLVAPRHGAIGLLHAGWRGAAAGILERGVERMCSISRATPGDIVMHCGVAISGPCYEVGHEVMAGLGVPARGEGPWQLDLRAALAERASGLGIAEVTLSGHCTAREAGHFHSHRRSSGRDGRQVAWLGIPPANSD